MPLITTRITAGQSATLKNSPLTNAEIDNNFININNAIIASQDVTGFPDRTTSTISWIDATRTLTLTPVGGLTVFFRGAAYTISSAKTITITNSSGGQFIYYDYTTDSLKDAGAAPNFATQIVVAYIYWNSVDSKAVIIGDERHQASRDTTWHGYQHNTIGTIWKSGGDASYTVNNTNTVTLSIAGPVVIADEDLDHTIVDSVSPANQFEQTLSGPGNFPILYLSGTNYRQIDPTTVPWYPSTTRAYYNQISAGSGALATATADNNYIVYWVVATNDTRYPIKLIMGRGEYSDYGSAETEDFNAYNLSLPEIAPMYKIILQTSSSFTGNTARVKIAGVRELIGKQNARSNSFDTLSHNALSDRNLADQHSIASITNLQTTLDSVAGASVAMAIALG